MKDFLKYWKLIPSCVYFLGAISISLNAHAESKTISGLYVNAFGDPSKSALLYIHGGPGDDSSNFEVTDAPVLAGLGYYVVVYDERGQGRSTYSSGQAGYNYKTYSDDLHTIIQTLNLKSPVLLAHSHGGMVAAHFDQDYPGVAAKIILLDAPTNFWGIFEAIKTNCTTLLQLSRNTETISQLNIAFDTASADSASFPSSNLGELTQSVETIFQIAANCGRQNGLYSAPGAAKNAATLYGQWGTFYQQDVLPSIQAAPESMDPVEGFLASANYIHGDFSKSIKTSSAKYYGIYGDQDGLFTIDTLNQIKASLGSASPVAFQIVHGASHNVFMDQQADFNTALLKALSD